MFVAEWGDRPIADITPRDVRQVIEKIKRRAAFDTRNAWGHVSAVSVGGAQRDDRDVPRASLDKRLLFRGADIEPRQRILDADEVLALWRASGRLGAAGAAYRLLLLTGCRVNEIVGARWSELHPELRKALRDAAKKNEPVDWSTVPDAHKILIVPGSDSSRTLNTPCI